METGAQLQQGADAASERDASVRRRECAGKDAQEGAFAGAIATHDPECLPGRYAERNLLKGDDSLVVAASHQGLAKKCRRPAE